MSKSRLNIFFRMLAQPPSGFLQRHSLICRPTDQYYLANNNVCGLYISCIIFCHAVTKVRLSFVQ